LGKEQATQKLIEGKETELYKEAANSLKKMNHLITAITFTVTLGIASGAPLLTCDKIKYVNQGKDNHDRYLVILRDPKSYQDAEYVIGLVDLYQWSLEMNAFNIHENLVRSQLEPLDNVGLQGTLSKQALVLVSFIQCKIYTNSFAKIYAQVCMDSRVESIIPDYPGLTKDSGKVTEEDTVDCSKLILTEPYNGEDYSVVLKPRVSTTDLENIVSRVEIEKLNDKSISFTYHHSSRRGKVIEMIVTMNTNALKLVCMMQCY